MNVEIFKIGETEFLTLGDVIVLPLKRFDFTVGGATGNSVQIVTDDPDEEIIFAYENCEAIYEVLLDANYNEAV